MSKQIKCLSAPANVKVMVGGVEEAYSFPDGNAVTVSDAAAKHLLRLGGFEEVV